MRCFMGHVFGVSTGVKNNPDQRTFVKGYISPIRHGRRKAEMSELEISSPITPHHNDILMGRGGKNNQHTGNDQLRVLAREQCQEYLLSTKKGKSYISRELVRVVREMNPPGRFLKKNSDGVWEDVGDEVAREKASQALRDAVSLVSPDQRRMTTGDARMHQPQLPSMSSEQLFQHLRRSSSAPPIMDKSPEERAERKRWSEAPQDHHSWEKHPRSWRERGTPHYPPHVTPASATGKRRRYPPNNSPWMFRAENPPYASPTYIQSAPNLTRSYPTQSARSNESPAGLLGEVDGDMHEFDLFDGELLEESMERRSDTF